MEMNYPFQECMAARDLAHRAGKHLRQQFFPKMPYKEAKSLFEARAILIDAQNVTRHNLLPRDSHDVSQCVSQIYAG
jgi:hypothetical protein